MPKRKGKGHVLENIALITHIGLIMITPIIVGVYLGKWIDGKLNTQPIFLFVFIVMGAIAAFINLFKVATKDIKK